jgi:hypothetical protein
MIKYRVTYAEGYTESPDLKEAEILAEVNKGAIEKFDITFEVDGADFAELSESTLKDNPFTAKIVEKQIKISEEIIKEKP